MNDVWCLTPQLLAAVHRHNMQHNNNSSRADSDDPQSVYLLQDIKGFVFEFCRDQHGSRFIQQKLADASAEEIMAVYEEVEPQAITLMQDVFGNYVIQKCFEHGNKVSHL